MLVVSRDLLDLD
jgi:hypothetical protein